MPTASRRSGPGLIGELLEAPWRFEFFQAVRILETAFRHQGGSPPGPRDPVCEQIRFRNTTTLAFAPSELQAIHAEAPHAERDAPARGEAPRYRRVTLTPSFIGLLGVHGTLPNHYTELIAERERYDRARSARAFLDLFSNRSVGLFYQAWKKYRLACAYEHDRHNQFLPLVLALGGFGLGALRDRLRSADGGIDDESIAYLTGLLRLQPLSAAALQGALACHFRVAVRIEQFVGKWYALPPSQQSCLGRAGAPLGHGTLLGERLWQRNLRLRVFIGPLARARHQDFLPGGAQARALGTLLASLSSQFEYEVHPVLRAEDVTTTTLDARGARLGYDSFLCSRPAPCERADPRFELHAIH